MNTLAQTDYPAREAAAFAADRRLDPVWNDPDLRALLVCNREMFYWQLEKYKLGNLLISQYLVDTPFPCRPGLHIYFRSSRATCP